MGKRGDIRTCKNLSAYFVSSLLLCFSRRYEKGKIYFVFKGAKNHKGTGFTGQIII